MFVFINIFLFCASPPFTPIEENPSINWGSTSLENTF